MVYTPYYKERILIKKYLRFLVKSINQNATLTKECYPIIYEKINKIIEDATKRAEKEHELRAYKKGFWVRARHF
ncbi:hypothetical protein HYV88_01530 [Candidatus Woesearchaeota archaeon]|nr:hypothetical protein [Candidatus Woesearchaeota archaeon]